VLEIHVNKVQSCCNLRQANHVQYFAGSMVSCFSLVSTFYFVVMVLLVNQVGVRLCVVFPICLLLNEKLGFLKACKCLSASL